MDIAYHAFDFVIHVDRYLDGLFQNYGLWIYALLFLIVFCETGLVITPFLPGDSLLFVSGAIVASQHRSILALISLLWLAAVLGDSVNYLFGRMFGEKISRWIKPEYLLKTQAFYDRHGGKTIIIARFMPIIRTFAPFVAGLAKMNTRHFLYFNLIGAFIWVVGLCGAGYLLGNIPWVKQNLSIIIWGIVLVSVSPMIFEFFKVFFRKLYYQK